MKYLHIKSIDKYHPGYQDRTLIWCKTYFSMINSNPDFEMLCEIDKWRFVAFVMLELQIQDTVPLENNYLIRKGFNFKDRNLEKTLDSLAKMVEVVEINDVTEEKGSRTPHVTQSRVEESRVEESRVEGVVGSWNEFSKKHKNIPSIKFLSESRKKILRLRLKESHFDIKEIITAIEAQSFLTGNNDRGWCVNFDWIIKNDVNYLKILERKYQDGTTARRDSSIFRE